MKVLHLGKFFPPHRGGMETHLALLASGLERFVDVEVAVAAGGQPVGHETVGRVHVRRMRTLAVVAAMPICPDLFTVIRDVRPDVVHLHHPHPMAMLGYLWSGTTAPCVITYQSDIVRQRLLRHVAGPIVRETLRRSSAIIVTSPQYLETSAVLQPFRDKCHVVPLGLDALARTNVDPRVVTDLRGRYGRPVVLAVGRLTHYKGFEYLIQAMTHVDARLVIAGDGPLRRRLERLISSLGLCQRVDLLGEVADVMPYYEACDVFVLPSVTRNEAFGLVQLEAMAAGKPVVNTWLQTGVNHVCPAGVSALTVPPADAGALASAIRQLLVDPILAARLGAAGQVRAATDFSAAAMVSRTLAIYGGVVRAGSATAPVAATIL